MKNLLFVIASIMVMVGCSTDINEYRTADPELDVKRYFTGNVIAWGMVQDYQTQVTRRFCVDINGSWQGNKGVLAEKFYFNDGEITTRNWQLTKLENGKYQGTAEDVVGTAYGKQSGFAFHWQYQLLVPVDGETYTLTLDDWMYQTDQYRVFNRTKMKKFGITVAEITLFFDKSQPHNRCTYSDTNYETS